VPIKASSARQVEGLTADLASNRADTREAAVARLTLMGARAVDRLLVLLKSAAPSVARAAALRVLEAIADARALDAVLEAIDDPDPAVASAATSAARVFLRGPRGAAVVDRLTRAVLDSEREEGVRLEALRALADLERRTIAPLLDALQHDPSEAMQAATKLSSALDPVEVVRRAADRGLPDDPEELADALTRAGASVALPLLLRVIERVREREASEPASREAWIQVRARAHVTLAARGSRIALYDLRESIEAAASPLPVEFLSALSTAGDTSCLEAVAAAYARSMPTEGSTIAPGRKGDVWWRNHLVDVFRIIVDREQLTRRHAVVKKIEKRWGTALRDLWAGGAGGAKAGR
jgi:HEAT repeat protein